MEFDLGNEYIEFDECDEHVKRVPYNKKLDDKYYNMMKRCYREQNVDYEHYGGRGIEVCDEWKKSKQSFFRWCVDNGFEEGLEIDRIENDKGYSPDNCRFVTKQENRNNRSDSPKNKKI